MEDIRGMDYLKRLGSIYKGSKFCKIPRYDFKRFEEEAYDSSKDEKGAITNWSRKPLTLDEAIKAVDDGFRIGWIVPKGICVVDIDNKEEPLTEEYVTKILKAFEIKYSYNKSFHGIHIIFRDEQERIKNVSKEKCALNLVIDTRANEKGYIILPCNDPHREWGRLDDITEEIPYFLRPVMKENSTDSFIGMENGDGRNDALYRWYGKLKATRKLSQEEMEKSIRIINEYLFDVPLTNKELMATVLRESNSLAASSKKDTGSILNDIAEEVIAKHNIISYSDNYYLWNNHYYQRISETDIERLIHFDVSKALNQAKRNEIISFIRIKTQVSMTELDKEYTKIACQNGVINLADCSISDGNLTEYNTVAIPHKYNLDAKSERINDFMLMLAGGNLVKMEFLYQVIGYCLLKKNIFEKFFIFIGEGQTGKSTFINLIRKLLGEENCCDIKLQQYNNEYYLIKSVGKLVAFDGDAGETKKLEDAGVFKDFISGNTVNARQIRKEVTTFKPFAKTIICANKLPKINDDSSGLYRRMIIVELNNVIPEEKKDPQFLFKVTEEDYEYLLIKAVYAVHKLLQDKRFIINQSESAILNMFRCRQSPINEWLYDCEIAAKDIDGASCITLYNNYTMWCGANGYSKFMTSFNFKETICQYFTARTILVKGENNHAPRQIFQVDKNIDPDYKPFAEVTNAN